MQHRIAPLNRAPRRIRPPFDVDSYEPDPYRFGETNDQWRARRHADRVAALLEPLDGVDLGAYDRRIIDWLADWDIETVGTIASLIYRARAVDAPESVR
ncbi:hypothetical protein [Kibdelosporangium phytohabitans]|uniref:Uncharacterized protein n=1 Tax=Kibdelosporangium phytohabitans TaxID=860235 RepID=A0A0N9ICA2_9PSEU|nr:hypothetical protein [Kibdelosporangium phytohabitans]ALG12340.1 hypothetical protein AOZ06_40670 [Kibdelosporangium phytohabitans]MBE1463904.1 hypothetical protein [Kibdelosporangium phytohabitans]